MPKAPAVRIELPTGTHVMRSEGVVPEVYTGSSRIAYAAAHVVADPLRTSGEGGGAPTKIDWEATISFRRHLWSYGLRVADAMDTAQRGMGLDWPATRELIRLTAAEAPVGMLACGAGTDQLTAPATGPATGPAVLDDVIKGYEEQVAVVEDAGAQVVMMASRALAAAARGAEDYHHVYDTILRQVRRPVILHWLGEAFDPALAGYWGSSDLERATAAFLELVRAHAAKIDGVKVSLLDAEHEVRLRAALPDGVRLYTGDDFNYPGLIESGSHALLGIFDAIAPLAATALQALAAGGITKYRSILAPTVPLSRKIFETPTYNYKTGVVFLAWLRGHQDAFVLVNGAQSARSVTHLCEVFTLADDAGLFPDSELAVARMRAFLAVNT